jgi:hypothetical protein
MFRPGGATHSGVASEGGAGYTKVWKTSLRAHLAESDHTDEQKDLLSSERVVAYPEITSW